MANRQDRLRLTYGLIAAGLIMGLGGCSEEPTQVMEPLSAALSEPLPSQQLRWMGHWKGEGQREQLVREVRDEFSFRHPHIDLQFDYIHRYIV